MKKKRFYNNKKRNIKWTEKQTGRKISFADKYIEAGSGSHKFDAKRPKQKKKTKKNRDCDCGHSNCCDIGVSAD